MYIWSANTEADFKLNWNSVLVCLPLLSSVLREIPSLINHATALVFDETHAMCSKLFPSLKTSFISVSNINQEKIKQHYDLFLAYHKQINFLVNQVFVQLQII